MIHKLSNCQINNPLITLPDLLPDERNADHLFPILVANGKCDVLQDYMDINGVGTVCYYLFAPQKQECYSKEWWNVLQWNLSIWPAISLYEVKVIVELINMFC